MKPSVLQVLVVLIGAAVRLPGLLRPGISTDEEFTWFAVAGMVTHWLPVLPSGAVYDRGLLYTAAAKAASLIGAESLLAYRSVSFIAGLCTIWVVYRFASWLQPSRAGAAAAALMVALSPLHSQLSTWARFYALFLLCYVLATHWSLKTLEDDHRSLRLGVALALACRLSHELAWTLLFLPAAAWLLRGETSRDRTRLRDVAMSIGIGLIVGELVLLAINVLAPDPRHLARAWPLDLDDRFVFPPMHLISLLPAWLSVAGAVVTVSASAAALVLGRYSLAIGILIAGCCGFAQYSLAVLIAIAAVLRGTFSTAVACALTIGATAASIVLWIVGLYLALGAPLSPSLGLSVLSQGTAFATAGIYFLTTHQPMTVAIVVAAIVAGTRNSSVLRPRVHCLAVVVMLWVVLLGVTNQSFEPRFLAGLLLIAIVISSSVVAHLAARDWRLAATLALVLVISSVAQELHSLRVVSSSGAEIRVIDKTAWQLSTRSHSGLAALARELLPTDTVACDDELLTRLFVGRCDRLLAIGMPGGTYPTLDGLTGRLGGTLVISSFEELSHVAAREPRRRTWAVLTGNGGFPPPDQEPYRVALKASAAWHDDGESVVLLAYPLPR